MEKNYVLTDVASQTQIDDLVIRPSDVSGKADGYLVTKRTLRGGLSEGVDEIRVDNGEFALCVLPTRGMSVWKAWLGEEEIGWRSPVRGPVHPKFVPLMEPSGLGWLDGFDELLVRCGLESNGAPDFDDKQRLRYPLHGRIGNRPAHEVRVAVDGDAGEISVHGVVDETRFHFQKLRLTTVIKTRVGERGFRVYDTIENLSASPAESQILYHTNFGRPLLDAGARVVVPAKTVVPRTPWAVQGLDGWDSYQGEQVGFEEQVYFLDLYADDSGRTKTLLKNAHGTRGVSLEFRVEQLPYFTIWKDTAAGPDGYVTGLEPGTNFPNPRSFEGQQGRVLKLAPGAKATFEIGLTYHADAASVEQAEASVRKLQQQPPQVLREAPPGWCAE